MIYGTVSQQRTSGFSILTSVNRCATGERKHRFCMAFLSPPPTEYNCKFRVPGPALEYYKLSTSQIGTLSSLSMPEHTKTVQFITSGACFDVQKEPQTLRLTVNGISRGLPPPKGPFKLVEMVGVNRAACTVVWDAC